MTHDRRRDLDRFYAFLDAMERRHGMRRRLRDIDRHVTLPDRGVYFFFEDGEFREDGSTQRVVRVGTHALRPSASTMRGRLKQHRGTAGGSLPGGGNHRGSVFRLHVGVALIARDGWGPPISETWSKGSNADRTTRTAEHPLEIAVSNHIGAMSVLWVGVADSPSSASDRGVIERGAIALLSNAGRPTIDPPSASWLGRFSTRADIRTSGLWNVNHVREQSYLGLFDALDRWGAT